MLQGTSVSRIVVPKNVKDVGSSWSNGPFAGALDLKEVVFEEGMTKIPDYICASGSYYMSYIEKVVIPASAKTIGQNAFYNCDGITAIDLKNTEQIGNNAFCGCDNLRALIVPKSVSTIGVSAFGSCTSLGSVTFSYNDAVYNTGNGSQLHALTIESSAFSGCTSLSSVKLTENVTSIGGGGVSGILHAPGDIGQPDSGA